MEIFGNISTHLMVLKPASLMVMLESELKNKSLDEIVQSLANVGSVETLTELKMSLVEEACDSVAEFPEGELYTRRKPKAKSAYNTLEERLAVDIAELFTSLDAGVVTSEVGAMFKGNGHGDH